MLVLRLPARFPLRFLIALVLGALHSFAFLADSAWPLEIATLAGLVALCGVRPGNAREPWAEARAGFAFGLGWFLAGTHWIYISMHTYGAMPALLAALATLLLCAYMALYPALACGAQAWLARRFGLSARDTTLLLFPALWMLSEWLRGTVFTGYPWLASGYAHVAGPLAGYAPVVGVYGVALAAALVAGAIALAGAQSHSGARGHARLALATAMGVILAGSLLARIEWSHPSAAPLSVRLIQGNIDQDLKFVEARFEKTLDTYLRLTEAGPADLIVLPETAMPRFLHQLPPEVMARLSAFANATRSSIAFGVPIFNGERGYFNSVVAVTPGAPDGQSLQRYDKHHLVPFGEFIPPGFRWFVDLMRIPLGDFARGAVMQPPMRLAGTKVAFNICYEDLFPDEIARGARDANLLVNVSNVAWFGDSLALPQHLQAARMRAIETARPMLRATNTGMTAAIDPRGRVLTQLEPFSTGALAVRIAPYAGDTPYLRWRDGGALLIGALMVVAAVLARRRVGANDALANAGNHP